MANPIKIMGLSPVGKLGDSGFYSTASLYHIAKADTHGFAIGDPVVGANSADGVGTPDVTLASAGDSKVIRGVIVGLGVGQPGVMAPTWSTGNVRPAAASSDDWYCMVVEDPDTLFEVSEPATGTALTAANSGKEANLAVGTNNGFVSGWTLSLTAATATEGQVTLIGLVQRPDNAYGNGAHWLCKIKARELV